jgi:hypothetical protein
MYLTVDLSYDYTPVSGGQRVFSVADEIPRLSMFDQHLTVALQNAFTNSLVTLRRSKWMFIEGIKLYSALLFHQVCFNEPGSFKHPNYRHPLASPRCLIFEQSQTMKKLSVGGKRLSTWVLSKHSTI